MVNFQGQEARSVVRVTSHNDQVTFEGLAEASFWTRSVDEVF